MSGSEFLKRATKRITKSEALYEEDIEKAFVKYAKSKRCVAEKLIYKDKRGFPDRSVLCRGGFIFFIEFKRDGKKQDKNQEKAQATLERLGFEYYVCDKIGQAEAILDEILAMESP